MASVNINDEKRLIVSIKDISSLNTSIGETQTVSTDTSDINYIPGYVEAEKQRRENETERIENENERKAYYKGIQEKVNNGEFKGEKGDKGDKGENGAPGQSGVTDYNELQNKPLIPTKTSELVNDSDFVNSSDLDSKQDKLIAGPNIVIEGNVISSTGGGGTTGTTDYSDLINKPKINGTTLSGDKTLSELGIQEKGKYIENESDPVYTADKPNIALKTELFSKDYNDLANKPTIPTKLSQLENDSEFLTEYTETDPLYSKEKSSLALKSELFSRNYNDLTNTPNIPTKVSDLTNDSGFINSIPDEYITETELNSKGYITEHQDISGKVDKEKGKGLSTNDFSTEEKTKLAGIEAGAEVNKVTSVNNQVGNVSIVIPSKTSDLTNDSSFLTETKFEEKITKKIINSLTGSAVGNFYYFSAAKQIEVSENERIIVTIPFEENTNNLYIQVNIGNFVNDLFLKDGTKVKPGDFNSTCLAIVYYTSKEINVHGQINYGGWIIEALFNDISDIQNYIKENFSLSSFTNDGKYVFYNGDSQIGTIKTSIKSVDATKKNVILDCDLYGIDISYYGKLKIPKINDYNNFSIFIDVGNTECIPIYKYKNNPLKSDEISKDTTFSFNCNNKKDKIYLTYNLVDFLPTKTSDLTNDKGYITSYTETDPIYTADKPSLALKSEIPNNDDFSLSGLSEKSYNNLTDKPIIPSKTSDLTNDSGFISSDILYDNPSGATSGITLSESITNFKKIKLYFLTEDAHSGCDEAYSNGKTQIIFSIFRGSVTGTNVPTMYIKTARITINDKTVTIDRQGSFDLKTGNNNNTFTSGAAVKIIKIEGYERITGE